MAYLLVFILGLIIGSFLNVCIYRIPRKMSILRPASFCPNCRKLIKPWDNMPILSYIILWGKCRYCGVKISPLYPLVEFLNGLFYMGIFWRYELNLNSIVFMIYLSTLIVITFIDLNFQIIPDTITLPGTVIALLFGMFIVHDPFEKDVALGIGQSVAGIFFGFGLFYAVAVLSKGGMGGGDIKMMTMVGALTGWKGVLMTTFLGSLLGSIIGIGLMIFKGKGRKSKIPFGPFLAVASIVSLLFGEELLNLYLHSI